MTDAVPAPIVYVDANPFIYFIDGAEDVASRVQPIFELLASRPGIATTSELTLAEVLAKAQPNARRSYLNLIIWSKLVQLQPVTRDILIDTADYRQVSQKARPDGTHATIKLPDAVHVVTAIQCRCRMFLSADEGLAVPVGMTIVPPNEAGLVRLKQELA
jgi:predicted nucleic acid-binding protein